jgi:hypothetical protein
VQEIRPSVARDSEPRAEVPTEASTSVVSTVDVPATRGQEATDVTPAVQESETAREVRAQLVERVLHGARLQTRGGQTTLRIRLRPEELGVVDVTLVERNGVIDVRIDAASDSAREALETGIAQLRRGLTEGGLPVQRIDVAPAARPADASPSSGYDLLHLGQQHAEHGSSSGQAGQGWRQAVARPHGLPAQSHARAVPDAPDGGAGAAPRSPHSIDYRV